MYTSAIYTAKSYGCYKYHSVMKRDHNNTLPITTISCYKYSVILHDSLPVSSK